MIRKKLHLDGRRNKIDITSGFTDLKEERRDSYVREFIDKLKEKTSSSNMSSSSTNSDVAEDT